MPQGNAGIDPALVDILIERIRRETSEFEQHVEGEPFLPENDTEAQTKFRQYCRDIESIIGCDPETLQSPHDLQQHPSTLYHANWMHIPRNGMFLDQHRTEKPPDLIRDHTAVLRSYMSRIGEALADTEAFVGIERYLGHNRTGTSENLLSIKLPFLLILYVSGRTPANPSVCYHVVSDVFWSGNARNAAQLEPFAAAVNEAAPDAFFSLHYVKLPDTGLVNAAHEDARESLASIAHRITEGSHPVQGGIGRKFIEAITLHFQRQWGDREAHLRKLAERDRTVQNRVSHELSRHLCYAMELLDHAQSLIPEMGTRESQSVGHFVTAAEECVRACFAAPWLSRFMVKEGKGARIWDTHRSPSPDEIAALLAMFDRKLVSICNAERPLDFSVLLSSEQRIDGRAIAAPLELDLGHAPGDWRPDSKFLSWPIDYRPNESVISAEGRQALLFGPQSELLRNAVSAAGDMDDDVAAHGIQVVVDVASDGSWIKGRVRNKLHTGHVLSGPQRAIPAKIEAMSVGLKAKLIETPGWFDVEWVLTLDRSGENANGGEA